MREFLDTDSLAAAVKVYLAREPRGVVAIEGHSTSGKSHLGRDLAKRLDAVVLETDSYARDGSDAPTYLEAIDVGRLGSDLDRHAGEGGRVIMEGICLRDTLRELAITPTLFIYVKRMTPAGLWADELENYLEDGRPAEGLSWTDYQSVEYHVRERPEDRADFVYVRTEE